MYPISLVGTNRLAELELACKEENVLEMIDRFGNTALLKACYLGAYCDFKILIKYKANLLAMNSYGQNALTLAVYSGNKPIVCDLLKLENYSKLALSCMTPPVCVAALANRMEFMEFFSEMDKSSVKTVHGLQASDLIKMRNFVSKHSLL